MELLTTEDLENLAKPHIGKSAEDFDVMVEAWGIEPQARIAAAEYVTIGVARAMMTGIPGKDTSLAGALFAAFTSGFDLALLAAQEVELRRQAEQPVES